MTEKRFRTYEMVCSACGIEREMRLKAEHIDGGIMARCPECFGFEATGQSRYRLFVWTDPAPDTPNAVYCKQCERFVGDRKRDRCPNGHFTSKEVIDPDDFSVPVKSKDRRA